MVLALPELVYQVLAVDAVGRGLVLSSDMIAKSGQRHPPKSLASL